VLGEILPEQIAKLPWPKKHALGPMAIFRWVRPLHSIIATFDGEVIPFEIAGVKKRQYHARASVPCFRVKSPSGVFEDYEKRLGDGACDPGGARSGAEIILHEGRAEGIRARARIDPGRRPSPMR